MWCQYLKTILMQGRWRMIGLVLWRTLTPSAGLRPARTSLPTARASLCRRSRAAHLAGRPELLPNRPGSPTKSQSPLAPRAEPATIKSIKAHTEGIDMTAQDIAAALQRVGTVLQRRPEMGLQDDTPATARWENGTRVVANHANGTQMTTDMPGELGGTGDQVTPGWLFRAGLASCAATSIAMSAAAKGIELTTLEVRANSRSDTRGLLGMADAQGEQVHAGPRDVQLHIRISAHGIAPARLRALVEDGVRCSPIPHAVVNAVPVALHIDVDAG